MISGECIDEKYIYFRSYLLSGSNVFFGLPYLQEMIQILLRVFSRVFPSTNYR